MVLTGYQFFEVLDLSYISEELFWSDRTIVFILFLFDDSEMNPKFKYFIFKL